VHEGLLVQAFFWEEHHVITRAVTRSVFTAPAGVDARLDTKPIITCLAGAVNGSG
jgi:hypothetical protein